MTNKKIILQELVQRGEEAYGRIPQLSALPCGRDEVTASFVVTDPAMMATAQAIGLEAATVIAMIQGEAWHGINLKPIEAAWLAPAFEPEHHQQIAAALECAQRKFWEAQHFYLDEMAGPQAGAIPNVFMRDTLLAVEERAVAHLREKLNDGTQTPIIWIDYAAGPASFVNGALHRLQAEGFDLSRIHIVLVEPARHFREYAQQQPILRELLSQGRLFVIEGILEDRDTYERVAAVLHIKFARRADLITQAFGASYVADHLRPAMWKEMFGTAQAEALKMVIAPTTKYNPSRMITDRLKDEVKKRQQTHSKGGAGVSAISVFAQAFGAWVTAFARPVPVDKTGQTRPALVALIQYGQGIKKHCPIRQTGEAFEDEIRQATAQSARSITPVLDDQAILLEL
jgi:hypothetical protein